MASSQMKDPPGMIPDGVDKAFFGHPRGLATLFMTEMWERFSFYGMKALLPLYLISGAPNVSGQGGGLAMTGANATAIVSIYLAMVYLLAMPGGWIGDRLWGPRKTVVVSSVIVMAGHLCLAVPGEASFFVGLALVALGSGLLKANVSTMVGHLYAGPTDVRRDGGFTLFYIGINLGGFLAPLAIGTVGEKVNWHLGFTLAAIGMGLGLLQFLWGSRHLDAESSRVPRPLSKEERNSTLKYTLLGVAVIAVFYVAVVAADLYTLNWALVPITVAGLIIPVGVLVRMKRDKELTREEQSKLSGYVWFFAAAAIFWMIFDQGGSTLSIFAESSTNTSILGWSFPVSWFQSVNPVLIMACAPIAAWFWIFLAKKSREPNTVVKFSAGLTLAGLSFALFLIPLSYASSDNRVTPLWLVGIYLVQTIGELCLSPVGLSVTTKMAPAKYASSMMGVWFLAVTAGDCITGLLSIAGVDMNKSGVVAFEAILAIAAGICVFMYRKKVQPLMGEVH